MSASTPARPDSGGGEPAGDGLAATRLPASLRLRPRPPTGHPYGAREPAPASPRDIFELLSRMAPGETLDGLIDRTDFSTADGRALAALLVDDAPASADGPAADAFREALLSPAFRAAAIPAFLIAWPELTREIFVEIPAALPAEPWDDTREGRLIVPLNEAALRAASDDAFTSTLATLVRAAATHDRILIHGSLILGAFMAPLTVRAEDTVGAVLPDPVSCMVARANAAVARLRRDPAGRDAMTAHTLRHLGLDRLPADATDADLKELVIRCLRDPRIVPPNPACHHLGHGPGSGLNDAVVRIVAYNVELTTSHRHRLWAEPAAATAHAPRPGEVPVWLTVREAMRWYGPDLARATREDQVLFNLVCRGLETTGADSITGAALARLAEGRSLGDFARSLPDAPESRQPAEPFVTGDPAEIAVYRHNPPDRRPAPRAITFGPDGDGNEFLLTGWVPGPTGMPLSAGGRSVLRLPRCPGAGPRAFRLTAAPNGAIGRGQTLALAINDTAIATVTLYGLSLIELDIPPGLGEGPMTLTITHESAGEGIIPRRLEIVRYPA